MAVTECCLKYTTVSGEKNNKTSAIIVCGGSSTRMNGIDKMFSEVCGIPVAARSIMAFQTCGLINDIVVVVKKENMLKMQQLVTQYGLDKVTDIVEGGSCRQESVAKGLEQLTNNTDYVLIHDGARPFVTKDCIKRVIDGACEHSAVTCAVKLKDTVKVISKDGFVVKTPDRNSLISVQTPQGFSFELYKKAVNERKDSLSEFTDDCSVVESLGYPTYVVDGDYSNIKITTVEDLEYAAFIVGKGEHL